MSVLYFSKTFSATLNIVYLFSPVKGHSYAALKGRHLPAPIFCEVPHTIFVEWDATWDIAGELGIDENSTDKEIEQAILTSEDWHGETYQEEVQAYIDEQENN